MADACKVAEKQLHAQLMLDVADKSIQPGDERWFCMQALACGLSMLRAMQKEGADATPVRAEDFRKKWKTESPVAEEPPHGKP